MDTLTVSAVSGMKARLESLSLLANNIANSSSPGFKADSEVYSLYTGPSAETSQSPLIDAQWTDFSQGTPVATGNGTDIALRGSGFFQVAGPGDQRLLTRAGSFTISPDGRLITQESYSVLDPNGLPIAGLNPRAPLDINPAGELRQNAALVARLGIVEPENPSALAKRGALYFSANRAGNLKPATAETLQGRLESANVTAPAAAVRLIDVLRQFEMLQKAIQIGGQMNERLDDLARVGN